MYEIDYCPACGSKEIRTEPAKLAKFIASRVTGQIFPDDLINKAIFCNDCGFVGSAIRLTAAEENMLYKGYRNEEYNKLREACEPGYSEKIKKDNTEEALNDRKNDIAAMVQNYKFDSCLDYGGETGYFIPAYIPNKFVYDINEDTVLMPGVMRFDRNNRNKMHLVLCCHVLEHLSSFAAVLGEIRDMTLGFAYFEVPNNPAPYAGTFHEHLNLFNEKSLPHLLKLYGFDIIAVNSSKNLSVLAKPKWR